MGPFVRVFPSGDGKEERSPVFCIDCGEFQGLFAHRNMPSLQLTHSSGSPRGSRTFLQTVWYSHPYLLNSVKEGKVKHSWWVLQDMVQQSQHPKDKRVSLLVKNHASDYNPWMDCLRPPKKSLKLWEGLRGSPKCRTVGTHSASGLWDGAGWGHIPELIGRACLSCTISYI